MQKFISLSFVVLFSILIAGCGGGADPATSTPVAAVANGSQPPAPQPPPSTPPATPPASGPVAPAGAKLIDNIEDRSPWGHCTDCAAHPHNPNPPLAVWEFQQHQSTPSMDGSSVRFFVGGSAPYANALHWTKFGNQSQYKHFLYEFYVYASPESLNAQNLEFDLFQGVNGREFMFGSQCNYAKGFWQGWNGPAIAWVDFPQAPCKKFVPGTWTRVRWMLERTDDNKLHYISVTVGDTTWKVDNYQPPVSGSSWADTLGIQMQQDLNIRADDYAIWADQIKVWMW